MKIVKQVPVTTRKPSLRTKQKSLQWTFETLQTHKWMTRLRRQSVPSVRSRCGDVISWMEPRMTWDRGSRHTKSGKVDRRPAVQTLVS